eukprot:CAMPEP_0172377142 /NCGR_PEP_ID=MMETSP1060-20121228/68749_1 /TAXON_ID=37318 /ORGANISM="Pseudo-nitzschia pungens, Strain cf. cingulata" /LENGTH=527 /DNA_ID=CAMNT_0013104813 /DNA_START=84 /DNA_END=1667 /DNA_ORIENTATION=-
MTAILSPPCSHELKSSNGCRADDERIGNAETSDGTEAFVIARCREILAYYEEESQNPEHDMPRWLVEQLTREEQEVAAQCSHAYWYLLQHSLKRTTTSTASTSTASTSTASTSTASTSTSTSIPTHRVPIRESTRFATALREAIRHRDCAETAEDVLKMFRATLDFHRRNKTTLYRSCMSKEVFAENDDSRLLSKQRRERIDNELKHFQNKFVRGHDREDRSIFFAYPRVKPGTADDEEAFVDSLIYTMERAIAASEFQSIGRQDQILCVLEAKGCSCPPMKTCQAALGVLQHFYPGRLKSSVVLNPPYLVSALFKMVKPFMHPITVSKYLLTKVKQSEDSILSSLIDESQAMPEMMPGQGKLTSKVDIDHYLYSVPFYRLYDYTSGGKETVTATKSPLRLHQKTEEKQPIDLTACSTASLSPCSVTPTSVSSDSEKKRFRFRRKSSGGRRRKSLERDTMQQKPNARMQAGISVRSLAVGKLVIHNNPSSGASSSSSSSSRQQTSGVVDFQINPATPLVRGVSSVIG